MNRRKPKILKGILGLVLGIGLLSPMNVSAGNDNAAPEADNLFANVKQLAAGSLSTFAVKEDGSAWAWGAGYSSLGNGATTPAYTPIKVHIDQVKQISSGYRSTLFLRTDFTVWAVGGNEHGQLGNSSQSADITVEPFQVKGISDIKAVSSGEDHSLAVDHQGRVWAWGGNKYGQSGNDSGQNVLEPVQVKGLPTIVAVAAGDYVSMALGTDGQVWVWGLKQLNGGKLDLIRKPTLLSGTGEYGAIAVDHEDATALSFNGTVWTWKNYTSYKTVKTLEPIQVPGLSDIVSLSTYSAVKSDGTVWVWSKDLNDKIKVTQVEGIHDAATITGEDLNHYVLLKDGHVLSWGANGFGQTGLGVIDSTSDSPKLVKNSVAVLLEGKEIEMAMPPLIIKGVTFVPIRGILQQMGVSVKWDVSIRSVIATKGDVSIVLNSLTGQTTVNGNLNPSDQKPVNLNGTVLVPLRLIGETMGATVKWDAAHYSVLITS